jgi:hypothetical protein
VFTTILAYLIAFHRPRNDRRWYVGCSDFDLGKDGSHPSEVLRDDDRLAALAWLG